LRASVEDEPVSLPIDPDLDPVEDTAERTRPSPFDQSRPPRWPRLRADVMLVIFVGGCLGGWARYGITSAWPTRTGRFPWATLSVNVAGAFILTIVIVAAADIVSSRYLRPLLGTGFCGAFTTFSSIVVTSDLLFAHHHPGTAVAYLAASIVAGLAAASLGLVLGRAVAANRRRAREKRSTL
jgi:CrcB protein